jgi:hypothetical protein
MTTRSSLLALTGSALLVFLGGAGCAGKTRAQGTIVYDYPAVYVESVPANTVYHPRVQYRGRYAYLVDGRWYYPADRGWVVFREEPRELMRYRVNSGDRPPPRTERRRPY